MRRAEIPQLREPRFRCPSGHDQGRDRGAADVLLRSRRCPVPNRMRSAFVRRLASLTHAFVIVTTFIACSDDGAVTVPFQPPPPPPTAPVVSLSIFPLSRTLFVGDTAFFTYEALDATGRVVATVVEWTSDNPGVVSVARTVGKVTAIAVGTANISVAAGTLSATGVVTVRLLAATTIGSQRATSFSPSVTQSG